ncbi:MAG TPA: hypothetical protein V6D09_24900 [Leptolyngbyaceae cyanobacterium]
MTSTPLMPEKSGLELPIQQVRPINHNQRRSRPIEEGKKTLHA